MNSENRQWIEDLLSQGRSPEEVRDYLHQVGIDIPLDSIENLHGQSQRQKYMTKAERLKRASFRGRKG